MQTIKDKSVRNTGMISLAGINIVCACIHTYSGLVLFLVFQHKSCFFSTEYGTNPRKVDQPRRERVDHHFIIKTCHISQFTHISIIRVNDGMEKLEREKVEELKYYVMGYDATLA